MTALGSSSDNWHRPESVIRFSHRVHWQVEEEGWEDIFDEVYDLLHLAWWRARRKNSVDRCRALQQRLKAYLKVKRDYKLERLVDAIELGRHILGILQRSDSPSKCLA